MSLTFYKYSATGNDFILFDQRDWRFTGEETEFFRQVSQRRTAVGADGVLVVGPDEAVDFRLRYFNADGTEAACGNGARTAAYFFVQTREVRGPVRFRFDGELYEAEVAGKRVKLLLPAAHDWRERLGVVQEPELREGGFVNTGVPHLVLFCENVAGVDVTTVGKKYRFHRALAPEGVNVDFVEVRGPQHLVLRTYERGVEAETLSCGTGCVAAALVAHRQAGARFPVTVETTGGLLRVHLDETTGRPALEGEVQFVFEGRLSPEAAAALSHEPRQAAVTSGTG